LLVIAVEDSYFRAKPQSTIGRLRRTSRDEIEGFASCSLDRTASANTVERQIQPIMDINWEVFDGQGRVAGGRDEVWKGEGCKRQFMRSSRVSRSW